MNSPSRPSVRPAATTGGGIMKTYDELIKSGYEILSWSENRLVVISPKKDYEIWELTDNDLWRFLAKEHSNYSLKTL